MRASRDNFLAYPLAGVWSGSVENIAGTAGIMSKLLLMQSRAVHLTILFVVAVFGYIALARTGLGLATINVSASPVWPASGFAIAVVSRWGWRFAFAIFLGALVANAQTGISSLAALLIALGNAVEAYLGARILVQSATWLNRRPLKGTLGIDFTADRMRPDYLFGVTFASFGAATVGATVASISLFVLDELKGSGIGANWITWWIGDALGILVFFPIFQFGFSWKRWWPQRGQRHVWLISLPLVTVLALLTSHFVFSSAIGQPFLFLVFPCLLLAVLAAGEVGLLVSVFVIVVSGLAATLTGMSALSMGNLNESLISTQVFLGAVGITGLVLRSLSLIRFDRDVITLLLVGWFLSGTVYFSYYRSQDEKSEIHFQSLIASSENIIDQRMRTYFDVMSAGVGLFAGSEHVSRREWRNYVRALDLQKKYPGISGIGYTRRLPSDLNLRVYEQEQRQDDAPDFHVFPVPNAPQLQTSERHVIQYIEPIEQNSGALGLLTSSEQHRYEAAIRAMETGEPTITRRVRLVIDRFGRAGFLAYVPHYQADVPLHTRENRRQACLGWVHVPFVFREFMSAVVPLLSSELEFDVLEGEASLQGGSATTLFRSQLTVPKSEWSRWTAPKRRVLELGSLPFVFEWRRSPKFFVTQHESLPWVGTFGALFALVAAWMYANVKSYRVQAEQMVALQTNDIRNREQIWRTLMGAVPIGIFRANRSGSLTFVNPAYCRITGVPDDQFSAFRWYDILQPTDREGAKHAFSKLQERGEPVDLVVNLALPGGEDRWARLYLIPLLEDHVAKTDYIGIVDDITERVRHQNVVEAERAKMVHAAKMATLGEVSGGIAHEINNPLSIIVGRVEQIRKAIKGPIDTRAVEAYSDEIEKTSFRIAKIIKGLRAFSREASQDPMVDVDIAEILGDTLAICSERFRVHNITLRADIKSTAFIHCRPTQLSQVFLNLLNNAFDAVVNSEKPWVEIASHVGTHFVEISVMDSGHGIAREVADKIMQPFFTTKEVGKGTGLGLSISKSLLEDHGGTVTLDHVSVNTRFVIRLPLAGDGDLSH
ncbi:MAG: CHASE domain-containing protein [Bdellovibrionaceae bacterium]|nr:CHASE domain-containing protein [Pseudobdellovibrionaceae bacterium]